MHHFIWLLCHITVLIPFTITSNCLNNHCCLFLFREISVAVLSSYSVNYVFLPTIDGLLFQIRLRALTILINCICNAQFSATNRLISLFFYYPFNAAVCGNFTVYFWTVTVKEVHRYIFSSSYFPIPFLISWSFFLVCPANILIIAFTGLESGLWGLCGLPCALSRYSERMHPARGDGVILPLLSTKNPPVVISSYMRSRRIGISRSKRNVLTIFTDKYSRCWDTVSECNWHESS